MLPLDVFCSFFFNQAIKSSNIRSGEKGQDSNSKVTEDPLSMFSNASSGSDLDGTDPLSMLARGEEVSSIPSFGRKGLVRIINESKHDCDKL